MTAQVFSSFEESKMKSTEWILKNERIEKVLLKKHSHPKHFFHCLSKYRIAISLLDKSLYDGQRRRIGTGEVTSDLNPECHQVAHKLNCIHISHL